MSLSGSDANVKSVVKVLEVSTTGKSMRGGEGSGGKY